MLNWVSHARGARNRTMGATRRGALMKPTTSPLEELQLEMARHMVREAATKADMAEVQLKESLVRLEATKSLAEMAKIELRILKRSE